MPNDFNWRAHPPDQRTAIRASLDELGWIQRVIVNEHSMRIIDGHARVEQALEAGAETVPCVFVDLDEEEERQALLLLDPIAAMAGVNRDILAEAVRDIRFRHDSLQGIVDDLRAHHLQPRSDPRADAVQPVPADSTTERGQVFELGRHRLMCGDAQDAADVAKLLGEARPQLMITDPPYGVGYDATWRPGAKRTDGFEDQQADWREAFKLHPGDVVYAWHASVHAAEALEALRAASFDTRAQIVWAKAQHTFGRGHYHWQHEPCWYAVKKSGKAHWIGDRTQSTLWAIDALRGQEQPAEDEETAHATQKPVECMERPIRNHQGDVYDPFVGSGTTLIAAERLGRTAYLMDIDPRFVDMTKARYVEFTGGG